MLNYVLQKIRNCTILQLTPIVIKSIRRWPLCHCLGVVSSSNTIKTCLKNVSMNHCNKKCVGLQKTRVIKHTIQTRTYHMYSYFSSHVDYPLNLRDIKKKHKRQSCTTQEPNIKDWNLRHTVVKLRINSKATQQPVTFTNQELKNERSRDSGFTVV